MYLSMGNLLKDPHVGILFMDLEGRDRLRVNGEASVDFEDELRSWWPEAQFVVRVRAREIFPNCPPYVHRYQKVQASVFVPRDPGGVLAMNAIIPFEALTARPTCSH